MDLRNKKVTVVGLGDSGRESSLLLLRKGALVRITDNNADENIRGNAKLLKEAEIEIGQHTEPFLSGTELLVVSPGVENSSLPVRYAEKKGIPIISELELAYRFCEGPIIAVTGTNGKSTVVSLLGEILCRAGIPVNVCGNIGNPLSGEVGRINKNTFVVLEVSSFQLERIISFRPRISVILNVTDDHLDRHRDFEEYFNLKIRIFENQRDDDAVILNYGDTRLRKLAETGKIPCKSLYFNAGEKAESGYPGLENSRLKGAHNLENILAAAKAAELAGGDTASVKEALRNFTPLGHRFEMIAEIGGIEFIDDSKATNIDSTCRALLSLERPAVLIAGGKDKNLSYAQILPALKKAVKKIVLIGETRPKMRDAFKGHVALEESDSLEEAVGAAYKSAAPGDSVLLSPMCSSFDMFENYKHRGEVFRRAVEGLK